MLTFTCRILNSLNENKFTKSILITIVIGNSKHFKKLMNLTIKRNNLVTFFSIKKHLDEEKAEEMILFSTANPQNTQLSTIQTVF